MKKALNIYYKFPYLGEEEYGTALPAYGKTSDYYFIQWEEEDYLIVTWRESSGETVDGVSVYSMLGDSLIGMVLCLDKDIDKVRFLAMSLQERSSMIYAFPIIDESDGYSLK